MSVVLVICGVINCAEEVLLRGVCAFLAGNNLISLALYRLQRVAGGADEFAENGDVRAIYTDAAGIDRKIKTLGKIQIHTGVVKFRKTVALRGRNAIQSRRINRPGRTMTAPGPARQFIKLLPIAFLPSGHGDKSFRAVVDRVFPLHDFALFLFTARSQHWMLSLRKRFSDYIQ